MFTLVIILLAIVAVVGIFVPSKYVPKRRPRPRIHREAHGLPWMDPDYKKRKRREERKSSNFNF